MRNKLRLLSVVGIALLLAGATSWAAGLDTNTADLPADGVYVSEVDPFAAYAGPDLTCPGFMYHPL